MRFKLLIPVPCHGLKQNLLQPSRLQYLSPRQLFSSMLSSSQCVFSRFDSQLSLSLPTTLSLFSHLTSQIKHNDQPYRFYCSYEDSDDYYHVDFETLTVESYRSLIKTEEDEKLIADILNCYEIAKFETNDVPSTIKPNHMFELMKMRSDAWLGSLKYLSDKERIFRERKLRKSQIPRSSTYAEIQNILDSGLKPEMGVQFDGKTGAPIYGEWLNSHFIRLRQFDYRCSFVPNLLKSYLFGQRLVIDCDFDYSVIEAKKVAHDIEKTFASNRLANQPFGLTLTGLKNQLLMDLLREYSVFFTNNDGYLGIETYKEPFTEIFDGQKLIYLSHHAKERLVEFEEDAIYICGGLSVRTTEPLTLKKSNALKIPSYCLPTDSLSFRAMRNAKCFNLCETVRVMLNLKETANPIEAVKNGINSVRLKTEEELQREQNIRLKKMISIAKREKKLKPAR